MTEFFNLHGVTHCVRPGGAGVVALGSWVCVRASVTVWLWSPLYCMLEGVEVGDLAAPLTSSVVSAHYTYETVLL